MPRSLPASKRTPSGRLDHRPGPERTRFRAAAARRLTGWLGALGNVREFEAETALHFAYYNLCRPHQTLTKKYGRKTTPAMAAGVEQYPMTVHDLVGLLDRYEAVAA